MATGTTQKPASPKPRPNPVGSTSPDPSNYNNDDADPTQEFSKSASKSDRDKDDDEGVFQKPASPSAAPLSPVVASASLAPIKKKSPDPTHSSPLRRGLLTQLCAASDGEEEEEKEDEERDAVVKVRDEPLVSLHCAYTHIYTLHSHVDRLRCPARPPASAADTKRVPLVRMMMICSCSPYYLPIELLHGPLCQVTPPKPLSPIAPLSTFERRDSGAASVCNNR